MRDSSKNSSPKEDGTGVVKDGGEASSCGAVVWVVWSDMLDSRADPGLENGWNYIGELGEGTAKFEESEEAGSVDCGEW